MDLLNKILNLLFDWVLFPIKINPIGGLIIISLLFSALMLFVFKYASNQKGIEKQKNHLKAYLLEFRLYRDDLGLSLVAMKNLLKANFKYLKLVLKPMVILIVPTIITMIQLATWFEYRPLKIGESTLVSLRIRDGIALADIKLQVPESLTIETPPLRILDKHEIDWRIGALAEGEWTLSFRNHDAVISKFLVVADGFERLASRRLRQNSLAALLYPQEKTLPVNSFIEEIFFAYPHRLLSLWGWRVHWLAVFLVVSIVAGYLMKGFFRVHV